MVTFSDPRIEYTALAAAKLPNMRFDAAALVKFRAKVIFSALNGVRMFSSWL